MPKPIPNWRPTSSVERARAPAALPYPVERRPVGTQGCHQIGRSLGRAACGQSAADLMVILGHGRVHAAGPPAAVLTPATLAEVYGVQARIETGSLGTLQVIAERPLIPH